MKHADLINQMSLEEKVSFCSGFDYWHTGESERLSIPKITWTDGPHGIRKRSENKTKEEKTSLKGVPAICFPTAVTSACSWDPELLYEMGKLLGEECRKEEVGVLLGPGINIKRSPLCGRNFEYFSEDPYIAGEMAASYIEGQQSTGAQSSLKHFAANSQEYKRENGDSMVDMRALREIYLPAFEKAVKKSQPGTVMCSYNKINGVHASDNQWLLTDVLRKEWGFKGLVVTDWGAMNNTINGFKVGCDLNMPGGSTFMEKETLEAVKNGTLSEEDINTCVRRMLELAEKTEKTEKKKIDLTLHDRNHTIARKVAEQGAVLLKNEDKILPMDKEEAVLIGFMAETYRYQGAGSSHIHPTKLVSLKDVWKDVPYVACGDKDGQVKDDELIKAAEVAKNAKVAVVVAGLPDSYESEGFDRENMSMPEGHIRMIEAVAEANSHTVVVLLGGSAMELPWADKVKAILYMGLSGQAGGEACAALLSGEVNPSGKLTETWPMSYSDVISKETFGKKNTEYRESIYVGYRYYDKAKKAVRYPFGYGLSYTTFAYSDLKIDTAEGKDIVSCTITNTGDRKGAEVVQLYVGAPVNGIHRPVKELKNFGKVELEAGESKTLTFELDDRSYSLWQDGWKIQKGTYTILVGASSSDIRLEGTIEKEGEDLQIPSWQANSWYENMEGNPTREIWEKAMGHPVAIPVEPKKGSFDMDSTCMEMKDGSFVMKIQYKVTENIMAKGFGGKKDYSDPAFKMMMVCATDCPMRSVIISSGGMMKENLAKGLLAMANGHYLKGIKEMLSK